MRRVSLVSPPLVLFLSGCVTATVTGPTTPITQVIPPELTNEYPTVVVEGVEPSQTVGSLFAFVVLPVGSIVVRDPAALIADSVTRAIIVAGNPVTGERLLVRVTNLQLTAYDLLVTRRIVCSIEGTIHVSYASELAEIQPLSVTTSLSRFQSLAFSRQMSDVGRECLDQFGREVMRKIDARG